MRTDSFAGAFEIRGPLDRRALEAALLHCVRRHEALRCTFREAAGGGLVVDVAAPEDVKLAVYDRGVVGSEVEARAYVERFLGATDTRRGPWFVMGAMVRERSTTVHFACDHLVTDGMSMVIVLDEIAAAYEAFAGGHQPALPAVGGFLDHAGAERRRAEAVGADARGLEHWRGFIERNGGPFPKFPLDLGIEPGAGGPAVNATVTLLDPGGADALEARCREAGGGVAAGVLAAVGVSLRREGGPDVYRALVPVGTRGRGRHARTTGWLVNLVPVEFPVPAGAGFAQTLAAAGDASTRMIRGGRTPFVTVLRLLAPEHYARPWPHAVNFCSYMDVRDAPGTARNDDRQSAVYTSIPATNGLFLWLHRTPEGLHLNTVHVDTPEASRTRSSLVRTLAGTLESMAYWGVL
ncbi:condensation domain-containing protein [Streptomyces bambusae]|uniref:condensation domain-containing protein n=1 Tax=Streptomyces bambusae TaxID=1550616 RepID=UPI001CFF2BA5|nr:condensation domain-containing protein [Streptomyces bambusae]MCB5166547.1 condensation domain-containing protein [Streptomyces bambusae]